MLSVEGLVLGVERKVRLKTSCFLQITLGLVCLVGGYASAWASDPQLEKLTKWRGKTRDLYVLATSGRNPDYGKRTAASLIQDLLESLRPNENACEVFARVFLLKAVFELQLGQMDEAEWDFFTALSLYPSLSVSSFSVFPNASEHLNRWQKDWKERETSEDEAAKRRAAGEAEEPQKQGCIRPSKKEPAVVPQYPEAVRWSRLSGSVILSVVIDESGMPRRPYFTFNCYMASFQLSSLPRLGKSEEGKPVFRNRPGRFDVSRRWSAVSGADDSAGRHAALQKVTRFIVARP